MSDKQAEPPPNVPKAVETVGEFPYARLTEVLEQIQAKREATKKEQKPAA